MLKVSYKCRYINKFNGTYRNSIGKINLTFKLIEFKKSINLIRRKLFKIFKKSIVLDIENSIIKILYFKIKIFL